MSSTHEHHLKLAATPERVFRALQLAPEGAGTRLTFVHAGFLRAADIGDYPFGWPWFMANLTKEVEGE